MDATKLGQTIGARHMSDSIDEVNMAYDNVTAEAEKALDACKTTPKKKHSYDVSVTSTTEVTATPHQQQDNSKLLIKCDSLLSGLYIPTNPG